MNKNAADSFSGIPAIVLGSRIGEIVNKKEEIRPIVFASFAPVLLINISFIRKKKLQLSEQT